MSRRGASGFKSITSFIPADRQQLRKYSWLPDVLQLKGSVVYRIIGPVLTVTVFSVIVATCVEVYHIPLTLNNNVVPLLSVVVGLLLVFRNGTSYDRYYEGRKDFASLTANVRNLSRLVWTDIMVPPAKDDHMLHVLNGDQPSPNLVLRDDKIRVLKLLIAFVYATVHHLRNEVGTDYEDLDGLLPLDFEPQENIVVDQNTWLNRYASYSAIEGGIWQQVVSAAHRPQSSRRPSATSPRPERGNLVDENTGLLEQQHTSVVIEHSESSPYLPLPLLIAQEITATLYDFKSKGYADTLAPAGFNGLNLLVNSMIDNLSALERVATTPIPTSYGIHLKQCVTLYLFALPFTLIEAMRWRMVPIVTLVSFTLMGIEGIADEIEMPFGRDPSDLPLERYCASIRSEVEYIMQSLPEGGRRR